MGRHASSGVGVCGPSEHAPSVWQRLVAWGRQRFVVDVVITCAGCRERDARSIREYRLTLDEIATTKRWQQEATAAAVAHGEARRELEGQRSAFLAQIHRLETELAQERKITTILTDTLGNLGRVDYLVTDLRGALGDLREQSQSLRLADTKITAAVYRAQHPDERG